MLRTSAKRLLSASDFTRSVPLLLLTVTLAACSDSRHDAAGELLRLNDVLQQHASTYGRFPSTLNLDSPLEPTNAHFVPQRNVTVRLLGGSEDSYAAVAHAGIWMCLMSVGPATTSPPDCTPVGTTTSEAPDSIDSSTIDGLLKPASEELGEEPERR